MKSNQKSRRNFIGTIAAAGATAGLMVSNPLNAFTDAHKAFEVASDDLVANAERWLKTLEGKKLPVLFDMHEHKDFWAGIWTNIYLMTNSPGVGVCVVMRHGGFPFALNDAIWSKYQLGEFFKINDKNTGAPSVRNMYWEPKEKDYPLPGLEGIKALQQKGVAFCVCNMALKVYGGFIAQAKGLSADAVYNDFVNNLEPGVALVPAGVWAIGRLQQAPLSYGYVNAG